MTYDLAEKLLVLLKMCQPSDRLTILHSYVKEFGNMPNEFKEKLKGLMNEDIYGGAHTVKG